MAQLLLFSPSVAREERDETPRDRDRSRDLAPAKWRMQPCSTRKTRWRTNSPQQLERVSRTNIFSHFFMVSHALKYMKQGGLALQLDKRGMRVKVWCRALCGRLSYQLRLVRRRWAEVPIGRAGQPIEVAPCYVFLAFSASSYITGQVLHQFIPMVQARQMNTHVHIPIGKRSRLRRFVLNCENHREEAKQQLQRKIRKMAMATVMRKSSRSAAAMARRAFASVSVGTDLVSSAPGVSLQKARSWDEGVSSNFSTTPLSQIFNEKKVVIFGLPGAFTGVCSKAHVPSYKNNIEKLKAKGVDSVICVAINDPYVMNGWAETLEAKDAIEFYGDFDGSFHKSLELSLDLSSALLGHRSQRWSAYVVDGKVKVLNVEKVPSEFKVSGGEVILGQI
ncbi:hypothetical protein MRB53_031196 [Persea americana]|uniref:Uncharacterized protein n=1 Tax=Persea americana TaxID=3435 RepID=A0ACC2KPE9_PERAE|nr:hypothetical protein MRB53_031196 [Persea americana]